ncbi:hypothetical protein XENOCAPTIV_005249 [Xenoophorus captivus]|uniref:Uncharacterized protein n=1 Tax=Xenoophorus captivus TaxID=1517983 RepID=A0ABV0S6L5_9TELE
MFGSPEESHYHAKAIKQPFYMPNSTDNPQSLMNPKLDFMATTINAGLGEESIRQIKVDFTVKHRGVRTAKYRKVGESTENCACDTHDIDPEHKAKPICYWPQQEEVKVQEQPSQCPDLNMHIMQYRPTVYRNPGLFVRKYGQVDHLRRYKASFTTFSRIQAVIDVYGATHGIKIWVISTC